VLGIAQRTVFLEPGSSTLSATVKGDAPFTVIEPSALTAHPGGQTISVSGSDDVFLAYGRTADVKAWVGGDAHTNIRHKDGSGTLSTKAIAEAQPAASPPAGAPAEESAKPDAANPADSDLWLGEFTAKKSLTTTVSVPDGISVLVASDGTAPAPSHIRLSWAADNSTPMAGPLIVGGAILLLIGLVVYLLALLHLRRSRGPRRNLPRGPRMPRLPRVPRPKAIKASEITGPRRSMTRWTVVPVVLVSGLALGGCSADFWPSFDQSATDSTTATPTPKVTGVPDAAANVPPAAVTVPQLERIVRKIAVLTTDADANLNADAIAKRFTGPALEQRLANYKAKAKDPSVAALPALPAAPLTLSLPQQSESWPRVVMTVIQDEKDPTVAPTAVVLRQKSARANYLIEYAVQLEPAAQVPDVAPATIGAPVIAPDSKLLLLPPDKVAAAYADVLLKGKESPSFDLFEADGDNFRTQVDAGKTKTKAELPSTASIEFGTAAGSGPTVALATNDSGSIVAVSLAETETVKPVDPGATVGPNGAASKALSGIGATAKGIQSTYGDQLLFHVPAAGSNEKIVLLGFSQGLISSAELP